MVDIVGGVVQTDSEHIQAGPLTRELVEVLSRESHLTVLECLDDLGEDDGDKEQRLVEACGQAGLALWYNCLYRSYAVLTFDGVLLRVREDNLQCFEPSGPEDGGFDVFWPIDETFQQDFEVQLVEHLQNKGYVVVQLWKTPENREALAEYVEDTQGWLLPLQQFEAAYLGRENCTKYALVKPEDNQTSPGKQDDEAVQVYDRILSEAGLALEPYGEMLGSPLWGRLPGVLRVPIVDEEEECDLRPDDDPDDAEQIFWGQVNFLQRRVLMLICMIENSGGELQLILRDDLDEATCTLPLVRNRLVIFDCQVMGHRYSPLGSKSAAIQTWILKEALVSDTLDPVIVELPRQLQQARAHIMSMETSYPGKSLGPQHYWLASVGGVDALGRVPIARFDIDVYFKEEPDEGYTYASHGGFVSSGALRNFDNSRFRITPIEAMQMSPSQRTVLGTGYDALFRAGYSMSSLHGAECGTFLGDSGSLWVSELRQISAFEGMGKSPAVTGSRLSHALGMRGPVTTVDTACSSSLVAVTLAHDCVRKGVPDGRGDSLTSTHVPHALATGVSLMLNPRWFVLYCGPKMLSPTGRCFTFDGSANGYARGEGCGSLFIACSEDERHDAKMLACLTGSAVNQDGKSASMTAPHGPSQQQCILASLREMGLQPSEMAMAECHGTGTALGDPIEVGALRALTIEREAPILCSSAKTVIGHLEACAGIAGLMKCVCTVLFSSSSPNCHSNVLNPHLDLNGYPVCFTNEATDFDFKASMAGVSSFGFGGTNARGDIWGRAQVGPRATRQLVSHVDLDRENALYSRISENQTLGPVEGEIISAFGSWDAYQTLHELTRVGLCEFRFFVSIGETGREHFKLCLDEDRGCTFHPSCRNADEHQEISGPEPDTEKSNWWLIDGRAAGLPAGTVFRVVFTWKFSWEHGEDKSIRWQPLSDGSAGGTVNTPFQHSYYILGTWNSWRYQEMKSSDLEDGLWTFDVRIGLQGEEEFRIARDMDWRQAIHPARPKTRKTSIPICGPDSDGHGKAWLVHGSQGEVVSVKMRVLDGKITLSTSSPSRGVKVWESTKDDDTSEYSITGTMNSWRLTAMRTNPRDDGVFRAEVQVGETGEEEFQIVMGSNPQGRLCPYTRRADMGQARMLGLDGSGDSESSISRSLAWLIEGSPGEVFEVILDTRHGGQYGSVWWMEVEEAVAA